MSNSIPNDVSIHTLLTTAACRHQETHEIASLLADINEDVPEYAEIMQQSTTFGKMLQDVIAYHEEMRRWFMEHGDKLKDKAE